MNTIKGGAVELEIEGYEIGDKLLETPSGVIYRGKKNDLGEAVFLKVIKEGWEENKFNREGETLLKLNHPHIMKVQRLLRDKTPLAFELEPFESITLAQFIQSRNETPVTLKLKIAAQLIAAVTFLLQKNVAHLNIRPGSVLVNHLYICRLMNFSASMKLAELRSGKFPAADLRGQKPEYVSPEERYNEKAGHRSEQYSLGILLYELFTCSLPTLKQIEDGVSIPAVIVDEIGKDIAEVVKQMVRFQPRDRYPNMESCLSDFTADVETRTYS